MSEESNYTKLTALGIKLQRSAGQTKTLCPKCSETRKNKTEKCLSVNIDDGTYNCHNCDYQGGVGNYKPVKQYVKPQWTNATKLSDNVVKWFKGRGISQKTLQDMNIAEGKEFMPQRSRELPTVQFPYVRDGNVVNVKYRTPKKLFKLTKGAIMIFYNIDSIKGRDEVVICEGEMDCLSFIEAGYKTVVSVPNGGSQASLKLEYLDNCWKDFEKVKKIIVGTDNDEVGKRLQKELVRRLGDDRCYLIDYGDCKDGNEYLMKHGVTGLEEIVKNAKPFPIEGIFMADEMMADVTDLYDKGLPPGIKIGLGKPKAKNGLVPEDGFDDLLTFVLGQLTTITGTPSSGKSEFLDDICELLAVKEGWKFGVFSPENYPISLHLSKLVEKIVGKPFGKAGSEAPSRMTAEERDKAMGFIQEHFYFIRPKDENYSLENILRIGRKLILKYGINGMIIDPWNSIEHQVPPGIQETSFINQQLAKIYSFKQRYNIHFFLVAHPVKMNKVKNTGKYEVPTLYNISGSAHFYNRTDNGITVYRDFKEKHTRIYVQKVKFKHLGKIGDATLKYDYSCGRYAPEGITYDRRNHLDIDKEELVSLTEAAPVDEDELPF